MISSSDITDDEACVDEVRMSFRFFASVLIRRAQKVSVALLQSSLPRTKVAVTLCCGYWQVDLPAVCADKVMKAALKHIQLVAKAYAKGICV